MSKAAQILYLDTFVAGLFSNRSPLTVPAVNPGTVYERKHPDAFIDGSNMEISPRRTPIRRPGFPTYCSTAFGVSEWPLAAWSGRLSGTLYDIVDTQLSVQIFTPSLLSVIFTKSTTAKSFFQQVGNALFFSDGTTNSRWDGTTRTNNGVATPASAPAIANLNFHDIGGGIQTVHAWAPNYSYSGPASGVSTLWLKDPNGNMQFAFLNPTQVAKSGNSSPTWNVTTGGTTRDGDLTWTNSGPVGTWATGMATFLTAFGSSAIQNLFSGPNLSTSYAQSGSTAAWSGTLPGVLTCASASSVNSKILDLTAFGFAVPTGCTPTGVKFELTRYGSDTTPPNTGGHNSDVTIQLLKASAPAGSNKAAVGVGWGVVTPTLKTYGSVSDLWGTTVSDTDVNNSGFGIRIQVALVPGSGGSTHHAFITRAALTVYYTVGSITGAYTSTVIVDSNGNLQRIKTSGAVGGSAPTWSKTIGGTTTDSAATWECLGAGNVLAAFVGWKYAYSFHTLSAHTSTLSPSLSLFAPIIGTGVTLTGVGSDDTQVDKNDLYRTADGGSLFLYCASDNNVDSATSWSIFDNIQDVSLDATLVGPIAHANDAPPVGLTCLTSYMGRLWGFVGQNLYFSAGPDCTNGDGFQSWPPANVFPMPSSGVALIPNAMGLVVVLSDAVWVVLGGPQTLTFFTKPALDQIGALNSDCVARDGDSFYIYTATRQLLRLSSNGKENVGFPVSNILKASFDPTLSSLAIFRNGDDEGLFISNGVDTVLRMSLELGTWSPKATIVGGIGLIKSLETTAGTYTLLAGRPAGSGNLIGRNTASFLDGASQYGCFVTLGSLPVAPAGADGGSIKTIAMQYVIAGSDPTVAVLPNEISGAFTTLPFTAADPWRLPATATIKMNRHDWLGVGSGLANLLKHLQIKITFPTENAANEILGIGIVPANV